MRLPSPRQAPSRRPGLVETERDRLIRRGLLTPFDQLSGFERRVVAGQQLAGEDGRQRPERERGEGRVAYEMVEYTGPWNDIVDKSEALLHPNHSHPQTHRLPRPSPLTPASPPCPPPLSLLPCPPAPLLPHFCPAFVRYSLLAESGQHRRP